MWSYLALVFIGFNEESGPTSGETQRNEVRVLAFLCLCYVCSLMFMYHPKEMLYKRGSDVDFNTCRPVHSAAT